MTQNQLIELFETEQLRGIVERSEERGWIDPAELEVFANEQELAEEEVEQVTRELSTMTHEGLIEKTRGALVLLKPQVLEARLHEAMREGD